MDFSSCTIAYNQTGIPTINFSFFSSTSVIHFNTTLQPTITLPRGSVLNFTGFCNDTIGTQTSIASQKITIANSNPTNATILYPTENLLISDNSIDINITYPSDADGNSLTAYFYINGTLNSTSTGNSTYNSTDGEYNLTVVLSDGIYLSNTTLNSFKLDTSNPTDNISLSGISGAFFKENTSRVITASDFNLYGHNISLYSQDGRLIVSQESINIVSTTNSFLLHINTTYGDGNYTACSNESDDHTAEKIPDWEESKFKGEKEVGLDTGENTLGLKVLSVISYEDKGEKTQATDVTSDFSDISLTKEEDRYSVNVSYEKSDENDVYYEFTFELATDKKIYPRTSKYSGHSVSGEQWIDFEPYELISNVKNNEKSYFVTIGSDSPNLQFHSIGGINRVATCAGFAIDTVAPSLSNLTNLSSGVPPSVTGASVVLSATIKDMFLSVANFSHNATGSWVNTSVSLSSNSSYSSTISSGDLSTAKTVSWKLYVFDQAGNLAESNEQLFSITQAPSSSGSSNNNAGGSVAPQVYNQQLDLANPFGTDSTNGTCESGYLPFNGKCFPCPTGYLQHNIETGLVHCVTCSEGFKKEGNQCVLLPPRKPFNQLNATLDKYALKISSLFGTTNPLIGYFTIALTIGILGQQIVSKSRRKNG